MWSLRSALFLALICQVFAQSWNTAYVIDDFETSISAAPVIILVVPAVGVATAHGDTFTEDPNVLGGERDLLLQIEGGQSGAQMIASVTDGSWTTSSGACSGFSSLQYDGLEGGSTVDHTGLNCFDLTRSGTADAFIIETRASRATDFKFFVYSGSNAIGSVRIEVTPSDVTSANQTNYIPFSSFQGTGLNFQCVGAIEITVTVKDSSEFFLNHFAVGKAQSIPSQLASITPTPSRTNVNPYASASPTRTRTHTNTHACSSNSDCVWMSSAACTVGKCSNGHCVATAASNTGCCNNAVDCPYRTCYNAKCSNFQCGYAFVGCPNHSSSDDDGSNMWIMGVVAGCVLLVVLLCVIVFGLLVFIKKRRNARNDSVDVYNAMIGGM